MPNATPNIDSNITHNIGPNINPNITPPNATPNATSNEISISQLFLYSKNYVNRGMEHVEPLIQTRFQQY
ncbi:predicted protein [Histoplasma mississippiense (nom. inval.)]|uniref:predicted protein n=1 Tax=Ajellomyces capsulatus (strain NAm1 / WU24) TaxID=2059318 RepID=UPI000157D651|nr:predicted protein [Histoplasma mississippiense (nom. inval.)]EDN04917.1 predicted protein [Histoplasma mississippiense (nom. inval.)]